MLLFAHLIAIGEMDIQNTGITSLFADSQIFVLLGCVVIGIFLCNDFDYKIIENAISSGHTRISIVVGKMISLIFLISILTLPYTIATILAVSIDLEVSVYMPTAYLTIMGIASNGTSIVNLVILIILTILMYSAQLSVGILIMFWIKKPVIVIAVSYVSLLLLGPVLGLNEMTKGVMEYTPFGIDYTSFISNLEIMDFAQPIIISISFIAIFTILSILFFRKCEIK